MNQAAGRGRAEDGYALIAAVAGIALFASLALMMLNAVQGTVLMAGAELDRARLTAAADAGVAIALQGLMQSDPTRRWAIDGRPHRIGLDGYAVSIVVEDERGKIPLNRLNRDQASAMFAAAGLTGTDLAIATDSFLDWTDQNDEPEPNGAEADYYAPLGLRPRNGALQSVGELALIRGVGQSVAGRIIPYATVDFGAKGDFDPRYASAMARQVMADQTIETGIVSADQAQESGGTIASHGVGDRDTLIDHPLTIRVDASIGTRAHARRQLIVSLTGIGERPYLVLGRD